MKKLSILFVLAFFFLAGTTAFAQEVKEEIKKEVKKEMKTQKAELAVADLPDAVQKTLKESFADYNVKKAYKYKNDKGETVFYTKVEKDGKWLKIGLDANGKVFKKKEIEMKDETS
jgi:Na+-translocating ferredoxin:NAD+ oxidoreductase RnfG subunit